MKVTPITRCANIECPNKPHEGTFTTTTIVTAEKAPRNITLTLCGPCSDYLNGARAALEQNAFKGGFEAGRHSFKRDMHAAAYGNTVAGRASPRRFVFIGGKSDGQVIEVPPGFKTWRIAVPQETSFVSYEEYTSISPRPMKIDTYHKAYWYTSGARIAFVHESVFGKLRPAIWVRA